MGKNGQFHKNDRPFPRRDRLDSTRDRPACTGERPACAGERPACVDERPACASERPACADERPACTDERTACADNRPACDDDRPTGTPAIPAKKPLRLSLFSCVMAAAIPASGRILILESSFIPTKIRELISRLQSNGFTNRGGKGSHRNFTHPNVARPVTISGKPGDDAKLYQEKAVKRAIEESQK